MRLIITIFFIFLNIYSFCQIFEHKEGHFYKQPGKDISEKVEVEYFNEEFESFEIGYICRETKWERKYHHGIVWIPAHNDGTWKPIRSKRGYYWVFYWSDWTFCKY